MSCKCNGKCKVCKCKVEKKKKEKIKEYQHCATAHSKELNED